MSSNKDNRPAGRSGRRARTLLLGVLLPLVAAGCSDLTAGGLADADVVLSGDAPDPGSASAPATTPTTFASAPEADGGSETGAAGMQTGQPVGNVTVTLAVEIQSPDGTWIELTDGLQQATVDISGQQEPTLSEEELDPGIYPRVRVRFTEVRAQIESGLPVSGDVRVDFGEEGSLTVEQEVELDLEEDDAVEILLDLNTTQWLNAAGPALPVVAERHLRQAVDIRIR